MMAANRLIAFIVGATPGLGWELGQIVERGWTNKLLILFPLLSASERSARIAVVANLLAGTKWEASLEGADGAPLPLDRTSAMKRLMATSRSR
jgi:hypothetical protein